MRSSDKKSHILCYSCCCSFPIVCLFALILSPSAGIHQWNRFGVGHKEWRVQLDFTSLKRSNGSSFNSDAANKYSLVVHIILLHRIINFTTSRVTLWWMRIFSHLWKLSTSFHDTVTDVSNTIPIL